LLDAAVAAIALLVGDDGFEEMTAAKIRPERVGHPDFRIGDLPQQEVAHPHLAARADKEIRIGLAGRIEKVGEVLLVEVVGPDAGGIARRAASTISARPL